MQKKHIFFFDFLRAVACLAVVIIHCSGSLIDGALALDSSNKPLLYLTYTLNIVSRFAVPVFIMISGTILLSEDYDFKKEKIKKHIIKYLKLFVFWSVIYCIAFDVIKPLILGDTISISSCIGSLITGAYHMWYIYLIIGLYIISPLLRIWVNKKNIKYVRYFLILSLLFTFFIPTVLLILKNYIPVASNLMSYINTINPGYIGGYVTYFILGWYLNNIGIKDKTKVYILGIVAVVFTMILAFILLSQSKDVSFIYKTFSIHSLLYASAIFIFAKERFNSEKTSNNRYIKKLSENSLGIYLAHPFFLSIVTLIFHNKNIPTVLFIPCSFIVSLALSYLLTSILKKSKMLKEIV